MSVFVIRPNATYEAVVIDAKQEDSLKRLQRLVDGYIDTVPRDCGHEDVISAYCNEEGGIELGLNNLGAEVLAVLGYNYLAFPAGVRGPLVFTGIVDEDGEDGALDKAQIDALVAICKSIAATYEESAGGSGVIKYKALARESACLFRDGGLERLTGKKKDAATSAGAGSGSGAGVAGGKQAKTESKKA